MFVKLVYQKRWPNGQSADVGVSIRECDEVYFDAATERLLAINMGDKQTLIDLDTMAAVPDEDDQVKTTVMAYIMNDDGKTVDSFRLE